MSFQKTCPQNCSTRKWPAFYCLVKVNRSRRFSPFSLPLSCPFHSFSLFPSLSPSLACSLLSFACAPFAHLTLKRAKKNHLRTTGRQIQVGAHVARIRECLPVSVCARVCVCTCLHAKVTTS